jgi:hypothetical protein
VIALGRDVDIEIDERLRRAEEGADSRAGGEQRSRPEEQPGQERCHERGAEDPELCLLELAPVEGKRRDEKGNGEADPRDRAAACNRNPPDGGL